MWEKLSQPAGLRISRCEILQRATGWPTTTGVGRKLSKSDFLSPHGGKDMMLLEAIKRKAISLTVKWSMKLLYDPDIVRRIADISSGRVDLPRGLQGNIRTQLWVNATKETAEYVEQHMLTAKSCFGRDELFEFALSRVVLTGLYLEFGVEEGNSIKSIAKRVNATVHGFDSFEGLPEAWFDGYDKSSMSTDGRIPICPANVQLHVGWFDKTLPEFAATHNDQIAFMHIDCDLYSSTKTIFDILSDRICSGTVIQFDEYFNYPGWKNHEFKAFQDFIARTNLSYEYLGYDRTHFSVAVQIV